MALVQTCHQAKHDIGLGNKTTLLSATNAGHITSTALVAAGNNDHIHECLITILRTFINHSWLSPVLLFQLSSSCYVQVVWSHFFTYHVQLWSKGSSELLVLSHPSIVLHLSIMRAFWGKHYSFQISYHSLSRVQLSKHSKKNTNENHWGCIEYVSRPTSYERNTKRANDR